MPEIVAGIRIPDSKLAREATELLREHGTPLLFAHSLRVYLFGEIPAGDRDAVLVAYPRIDFKRGIVRAFADGFGFKPATAFGTMNTDVLERTLPGYRRPNFCDLIAANPLGVARGDQDEQDNSSR